MSHGTIFSESHVTIILYNSLCALKFIHSANILHWDIKPANILIRREARNALSFKLSDFGLGHVVLDRDHISSQVGGTPKYTSPELVNGDTRSATTKSDVWSLGVTLRAVVFQSNKVDVFKLSTRPGLFDINYTAFSDISLDKPTAEAINSMLKYLPEYRPLASQIMTILEASHARPLLSSQVCKHVEFLFWHRNRPPHPSQ